MLLSVIILKLGGDISIEDDIGSQVVTMAQL